MKNTIFLTFLLFSIPAIAQGFQNFDSLKTEGIVDKTQSDSFNEDKISKLNKLLESEASYFDQLINNESTETKELLKDPNVLLKTLESKKELEGGFNINQLVEFQQFISRSAAMEAKFPIVSAGGTGNTNIFAIQYIAYKEIQTENETKYLGYGLYMTIDTSSLTGEINASLPFLVASATVAKKQFSYNAVLKGFEGISAHELLKTAMPGSTFGIDTYVGYEKFKDAIISGLKSETLKISPLFIDPMFLMGDSNADSLAFARIHALINIAKKQTLNHALNNYEDKSISSQSTIREVYKKDANIENRNQFPSQEASNSAKARLKKITGISF